MTNVLEFHIELVGFEGPLGPGEFASMIEYIDRTNETIQVPSHRDFDHTINWDYRWCDMDFQNGLLKYDIEEIRWAYEEPFETGRVDADEIYAWHLCLSKIARVNSENGRFYDRIKKR